MVGAKLYLPSSNGLTHLPDPLVLVELVSFKKARKRLRLMSQEVV